MDPICVPGCDNALPVVSFDNCGPEVNLSEIEYLLVAHTDAAPFTSVTSLIEWTARVSNTSVDDDAIRQFSVTGDMPAPTEQEITISRQRKQVVNRAYVVNADVDESNDINHEAFRLIQCGGQFKFWFVTRSGHVFGGVDGINGSLKVNLALARGESAIHTYNMVASWNSKFFPERALWPLSGVVSGGGGGSALSISTQPTGAALNEGASKSFTVVAAGGTAPYTYQWKKGGVNIVGATSATYNIVGLVPSDAGSFTVTITDAAGTPATLTSAAAVLTVNAFDTVLTFAASATDSDQGVSGTVTAINATTTFAFDLVTPRTGTPMTMNISISAALVMVVDFTSDYDGDPFKFVSTTGTVYPGVFTNGAVGY